MAIREPVGDYEAIKDTPEGAVYLLNLVLRTNAETDDARMRKAMYLLKTLAMAAGVAEGRFAELIAMEFEP